MSLGKHTKPLQPSRVNRTGFSGFETLLQGQDALTEYGETEVFPDIRSWLNTEKRRFSPNTPVFIPIFPRSSERRNVCSRTFSFLGLC